MNQNKNATPTATDTDADTGTVNVTLKFKSKAARDAFMRPLASVDDLVLEWPYDVPVDECDTFGVTVLNPENDYEEIK